MTASEDQRTAFRFYLEGRIPRGTALRSLGLRECPGCGTLLDEADRDHSPSDCLVVEVMGS